MRRYLIPAIVAVGLAVGGLYLAIDNVTESQPENPCAGVSDVECERLITEARTEADAKYAAWLEEIQREPFDARVLPRTPFDGHYAPAKPDLPAAVREADIIMVGQVKALKFVPFVNAEVALAVERVIKGDAGAEITILQAGQLVPEIDTPGTWRVSTLAYSESAPVLFPGDRALLFLERDSTGTYSVQSFTGHYQLDAEKRVSALPGNPFASLANGRDLDLFLDAVSQALARPASH